MKKKRKWILAAVGALVALYLLFSLIYGCYFNTLLHDIYDANGDYAGKISQKVSEEMYHRLDFRTGHGVCGAPYNEQAGISFPIVLHWFGGGQTMYSYNYEKTARVTGDVLSGSWDIPVTVRFHLEGLRIVVDDVNEAP